MTIVVVKGSVHKATVPHCVLCKEVEVERTADQIVKNTRKLGF